MDTKWVLAVTKRTAQMCATQSMLYAAGLELVTATNLDAARAAMNGLAPKAVIVCRHSWSDDERESIASDVSALVPKAKFVIRCPGCVDYDEPAGKVGHLPDVTPFNPLIPTIMSADE